MKILNKWAAALLLLAAVGSGAFAQSQPDKSWREKVRAERIAFLTAEMDLTPEEAQVFWPVYNQAAKDRHDAGKKVMNAYKALAEAVERKASDAELNRLTEEYCAAVEKSRGNMSEYRERYLKILPAEKVARLYVGEEKFRRQQVCRIPRQGHPEGPKPEK